MALYINNVLTTVKEGTKITIARENPYFTGRGDYSMNVVLPLVGCVNNRNAFGHGARGGGVLDRPEVNHKKLAGKKYPASIRANRLKLDGHAIITDCTETEVTVQLVMGISAVKHPLDDEDTKINKLNLGTAWDDWPELFYADGAGGQEAMNPKDGNYNDFRVLFHAFPVLKNGGVEAVERMMRGDYPDTKCVCLPIYSEGDEVIANPVRWTQMENGTYNNTLAGRVYGEEDSDPNFTLMAPQPYLLDVIQRIFKAIGYPWENEEYWGNTTFARIILANARCALRIEHLLPSWSVKEFLQEVEAFFSGVFVFRDNSVRLIPRSEFYKTGRRIDILEVVDEWKVTVEKDNPDTLSAASNIDYKWDDVDPFLRLPDEVFEKAKIKYVETQDEIDEFIEATSQEELLSYLIINRRTGQKYAFSNTEDNIDNFTLKEVDQYAPIIRHEESREIDVELRIVPAQMTLWSGSVTYTNPTEFTETSDFGNNFACPIMRTSDWSRGREFGYIVNDAINPDFEVEKERAEDIDVLTVAFYSRNATEYSNNQSRVPAVKTATGVAFTRNNDQSIPKAISLDSTSTFPHDFFKLNSSMVNTIGWNMSNHIPIEQRVVREFTFIDDLGEFDPTLIYTIRGKNYACQKFELTFDSGFQMEPLKKGYFFEI